MVAEIIVDVCEFDKEFDYNIPEGMNVKAGCLVNIEFGRQPALGYVVKVKEKSEFEKLKNILSLVDENPCFDSETLALASFMKKAYHIKRVDALRLCVPQILVSGKIKKLMVVSFSEEADKEDILKKLHKNAKNQRQAVEYLADKKTEYQSVMNAKFGAQSVMSLIKNGCFKAGYIETNRIPYKKTGVTESKNIVLTQRQQEALNEIFKGDNKHILLHGVTGSGKTQVYLSAIEKVLSQNKTAIMLVPEISLTPQMLKNFRGRFGDKVALIHSGLSTGERFDEWRRINTGEAKIVLGARSALFAPIKNIGIIILDEEHDASYQSESNPRYNAADIAKFRADYNDAFMILGSATPSVETYRKSVLGELKLIEMPERVSGKLMPEIEIVDMTSELRNGNLGLFSNKLLIELENCFKNKNQAMLFVNRRGYASFLMCRECGYVAKCEDCDVSLTYHSEDNLLKCHYCGKQYKMLDKCPNCKSNNFRQGKIGTERVINEINKLFPDVKTLRMDNDTTRTKTAYVDILDKFGSGQADVLVGTQMIAKGHDFENVSLVGILDADMSLYFSDYRSPERTFQLVTQMSGRAGRAKHPGKVILQTYAPNHYIFRYAKNYDYKGFYKKEINSREVTLYPPFSVILRILITSENENDVVFTTKKMYNEIKVLVKENLNDFIYMQAMKAPVKRIQSKFRYQILMRIRPERKDYLTEKIFQIADDAANKKTTIFAEINPQNLN